MHCRRRCVRMWTGCSLTSTGCAIEPRGHEGHGLKSQEPNLTVTPVHSAEPRDHRTWRAQMHDHLQEARQDGGVADRELGSTNVERSAME